MHNTILLQVNNPNTMHFLYEMQKMELVKVLDEYTIFPEPNKLSDKFKGVFTKEARESFNEHTKKMREEWDSI